MATPRVFLALAASLAAAAAAIPAGRSAAEELEVDVHDDDEDSDADSDEGGEDDLLEAEKREEANRAYVSGKEEGSLASPIKLDHEDKAAKLCTDLQSPRSAAADADVDLGELRKRRREAFRNVYSVTVAPRGFKLGGYRHRGNVLPLKLDSIVALDGALKLIAGRSGGNTFALAPKDASAVINDDGAKKIALELVFRVDRAMADTMSACFSYPKSAAYALNIEPLSYALVDLSNQTRRAEAKTPALERLKQWMDPGKAKLSIAASIEGVADAEELTKGLEAKRTDLESCFSTILGSTSAAGVLAFDAAISPGGALTDVRLEAESLPDGDAITTCAGRVLGTVSGPKSARGSRAHIALAVERGDGA